MEEEEQLPLARMVTITRPSFWIFLAVCVALFISEWCIAGNSFGTDKNLWNQMALALVVFTGLTLHIIATRIKSESYQHIFLTYTLFFEIASVLAISFMIFLLR